MASLYTASATSTGGRDGGVRSADGILDLKVAMPKELGGQGGATNPEELFAAGYAACFHSALKRIAGERHLALGNSSVTVDVGLGPSDGGGFGLEVAIAASLPGLDHDKAVELVEAAHQLCPYSRATRNNIPVTLSVTDRAKAAATS
jgi:Ohr subfamily peroxiredoxin